MSALSPASQIELPEREPATVSVIIPTLNEAERIGGVIDCCRELGAAEIIVVDGGSEDGTLQAAEAADMCLRSERGRACQQNAGAKASRSDILLFLHADCRPSPGTLKAVTTAMRDERVVAGCFRQKIDARGLRYRLLERGNALRVRMCKWAYGDQGIFVRRAPFEKVGGFPDLKLMEDLFLMKRLKREGRIVLLDAELEVSARRWQKQGVIPQTLRNWTLTFLAQCGVSPNRLARFYPHVR